MTTPIGAPAATASAPAPTASTLADAGMGKDAFMKLLVAQLKYQNPMAPSDGGQYMSQMAVFAQVEKLGQLVEAQATAQQWQERISAEGLVGRKVTGTSDDAAHTGVVTSVVLGGDDGPQLTLDDGSVLSLDGVTKVEQQ